MGNMRTQKMIKLLFLLAIFAPRCGAFNQGNPDSLVANSYSQDSSGPKSGETRQNKEALVNEAYADLFGQKDSIRNPPHYDEGSLWSDTSPFNSPHEYKPNPDFKIGDTIVVQIEEKFRTRDDIRYTNETESELKFNISRLWTQGLERRIFGSEDGATDFPQIDISGNDDYEATARGQIRSELTMEIPCAVRKILPDGRLLIEGRSTRLISRDRKHYLLSGIVHPDDVEPDERTISSTRVVDAKISWEGKGPAQDVMKPGLVNRILDYIPLF